MSVASGEHVRPPSAPALARRALFVLPLLCVTPMFSRANDVIVHDLHGLARLPLPARWRFRGLETRHRDLAPAAQLARHGGGPLLFLFDADARNSWGGHALDPLLLNVVLMDPSAPGATPERGFSIARYYSPTGTTIPLDDARWQRRDEGDGPKRRIWRWLAMNDHFGTSAEPRWAMSAYEPARALRIDLFAWRSKLDLAAAQALVREALDGLQVLPARAAFFGQTGTPESRQATLRAAHVEAFFGALAPIGVAVATPGQVSVGQDAAAWQDSDGQALRALLRLARVPLDAVTGQDGDGRPRFTVVTPRGSLPSRPPEVLYWHGGSGSWRKTGLTSSTGPVDWPLLPIEAAAMERWAERDRLHLVLNFHAYQPPVLDDAGEVTEALADAKRWRAALRAGAVKGLTALDVVAERA